MGDTGISDEQMKALTDMIQQALTAGAAAAAGSGTSSSSSGTIVRKSLSKWATVGLDLNDSGFSKLHSKESHYSTDLVKYDFEPEKFEEYKNKLIEKVNRIHAIEVFTVEDDNSKQRFLPTEYTLLTFENITDNCNYHWIDPTGGFSAQEDLDKFTDNQLKSSCIGSYLLDSLTENAKRQLKAHKDTFTVTDKSGTDYIDGPAIFYAIADIVDPNNSQLVATAKTALRSLDVKDFGYSVIKMLAEFKVLTNRVAELGGQYSIDDQYLDFWACLKTMKQKKFADYVDQKEDVFRETGPPYPPIDDWIRIFDRKEVSMRSLNTWNVMSPEDEMIVALVSNLKQLNGGKNPKGKKKNDKDKPAADKKKDKTGKEKSKNQWIVPDWKKVPPKDGESKTKVVKDKTYHWCNKCREGEGLWALHKTHDDSYKNSQSDNDKSEKKDNKTKKVAFTSDTKKNDDKPSVKVTKSLLKNATAYLAQFEDFGEGGTQGS